jgi:hypothetical protein
MNPNHDELSTRELSLEELDAVAAGNIFGDIYRWAKSEVTGKVNQYVTAGRMLYDGLRTMFRHFF